MAISENDQARPALGERLGATMARVERVYLLILRAAVLVVATCLILYAGWLVISSLYKIVQSPDSVVEAPAVVAADELANAEMPSTAPRAVDPGTPKIDPVHRRYYADFIKRHYALFRTKFEPFRQPDDRQLTRDQFDDAFIDSEARLRAVAEGGLNFEADKNDLEDLLKVMTEASAKPVTGQRLRSYRAARKVRVAKRVARARTEYRQGWNRDSTACTDWYYQPYGCPEQRAVQIPYTETVYSLEYPEGTKSHIQIFRAFQDRYFKLLHDRREANRLKAADERLGILAGIEIGKLTLWTALQVIGGFIVLMFFFLLIAIERHQRRLADDERTAPTSS